MAHFKYTAEKNTGEVYSGVAEAKDRFALYDVVRREGGRIVTVEEDSNTDWFSLSYWNSKFSSVNQYDKILFARNLGAMLSAGLSLARALSVMARQTKNPKLLATINDVASEVRRGETLHGALAKFPDVFSGLFVAMVRAGEEGGDLASSLALAADQMERMYELRRKIRGAMMYPMIILVAIFGIGFLMMTQVVPSLSQTFKDMHAELPASTQFVINLSDFLSHNSLMALAIVVAVIGAIYMAMKTSAGKRASDFAFLHTPMIGTLVCQINAARTARTMASLLSAGVDMLSALEICGEVIQNSYFREVLAEAGKAVGGGDPLSAAFMRHEELYPAFVGEMMSVGEETGQTPELLKRLAVYYEAEVDAKTNNMSTIIEPFLMIIIGAAVGFFAMAMITPIYSLTSSM